MNRFKSTLFSVIGVLLLSAATGLLYVPNKIIGGGVTGISTVIHYITPIPTGVSILIINIVLLIAGYKTLGKSFTLQTLLCVVLNSVFVDFFAAVFPPITTDVVLASLFGGLLYGVGIGLTFVGGSSTGGTDILGKLIQNNKPHISIGKILLVMDTIIICLSYFVFKEANLSLYGILGMFVSTAVIDAIFRSLNRSKLVLVFSKFGNEIAKHLVNTSSRGVTILDAKGAYTGNSLEMLVCALKEWEISDFQKKILEIDSEAFIVFTETEQIVGNGFYVYR